MATKNIVEEIIKRLNENRMETIKTSVGSGTFARKMQGSESYKCVIQGDTFANALMALDYLLFDLGVDVGIDVDELNALLPTRNFTR